jgi:hypothetical protein
MISVGPFPVRQKCHYYYFEPNRRDPLLHLYRNVIWIDPTQSNPAYRRIVNYPAVRSTCPFYKMRNE